MPEDNGNGNVTEPAPVPTQPGGMKRGGGNPRGRGKGFGGRGGPPAKRPKLNVQEDKSPSSIPALIGSVPAPSTVMMSSYTSVFEVYCSNFGVRDLCNAVYRMASVQCRFREDDFQLNDLIYVSGLSLLARWTRILEKTGRPIVGASRLQKAVESLVLPNLICQYIESFGIVGTGHANFVPYFRSYRETIENHSRPTELVADESGDEEEELDVEADAEAPAVAPVPAPVARPLAQEREWWYDRCEAAPLAQGQDFPIDEERLWNYSQISGRVISKAAHFRTVLTQTLDGHQSMLVSRVNRERSQIQGVSPVALPDETAKLGATYAFRLVHNANNMLASLVRWPGLHNSNALLMRTRISSEFDGDAYLRTLAMNSVTK